MHLVAPSAIITPPFGQDRSTNGDLHRHRRGKRTPQLSSFIATSRQTEQEELEGLANLENARRPLRAGADEHRASTPLEAGAAKAKDGLAIAWAQRARRAVREDERFRVAGPMQAEANLVRSPAPSQRGPSAVVIIAVSEVDGPEAGRLGNQGATISTVDFCAV